MGEYNRDRQLAQVRVAYVAAVGRLNDALTRFDNSGIPMDPGPGRDPYPWAHEHVKIITAVAKEFTDVINTRRHWDNLRREGFQLQSCLTGS